MSSSRPQLPPKPYPEYGSHIDDFHNRFDGRDYYSSAPTDGQGQGYAHHPYYYQQHHQQQQPRLHSDQQRSLQPRLHSDQQRSLQPPLHSDQQQSLQPPFAGGEHHQRSFSNASFQSSAHTYRQHPPPMNSPGHGGQPFHSDPPGSGNASHWWTSGPADTTVQPPARYEYAADRRADAQPTQPAAPPPLPPQNSVWHQQVDAGTASRDRRLTTSDNQGASASSSSSSSSSSASASAPAPASYGQDYRDSTGLGAYIDAAWTPSDRPISSATGIISLYGGLRRGSDSSIDDDDEYDDEDDELPEYVTNRRASRPLPQPPVAPHPPASASSPRVPPNSSGLQEALALPPSRSEGADSRDPSPMPYSNPLTPPGTGAGTRQEGPSYFNSRARAGPPSFPDQLGPRGHFSEVGGESPMWSPTATSFSSGDESQSTRPTPPASEFGAAHRQQKSIGQLSAFSNDSWASSSEGASTISNRSNSNRRSDGRSTHASYSTDAAGAPSVPRLRVNSSASMRRPRAPLPPLPPRSPQEQNAGASGTSAQRPKTDSLSVTPTFGAQSEDDELNTPVQTTPTSQLPASFQSLSIGQGSTQPHSATHSGWRSSGDSHSPSISALSEESSAEDVGPLSFRIANSTKSNRYDRQTLRQSERMSRMAHVNFAMLSHLAMLLKEAVPRHPQVKGSVSYPSSFTGKDVVSTIQSLLPLELVRSAAGVSAATAEDSEGQDKIRKLCLHIARSLKGQLFFHEVDWGDTDLVDGVEQVYMFLRDSLATQSSAEGRSSKSASANGSRGYLGDTDQFDEDASFLAYDEEERKRDHPISAADLEELPTGVFVPLTSCYSPLCGRLSSTTSTGCYSPSCPRAQKSTLRRGLTLIGSAAAAELAPDVSTMPSAAGGVAHKAWAELVPKEVLDSLPKREVTRQNAILEHIQKEEDFLADLELLENLFIKGLEKPSPTGDPPPIPIGPERDEFIREVFANHRELVWHVRNFVERLHVRQREESPIIKSIGDLFLDAALEWQSAFISYVANYPIAKSRIVQEQAINPRFRQFVESCRRDPACRRLGLDNFIHRALPHLQRHPLLLQTIIDKTEESNADRDSCIRAKEIIVDQCKTADTDIQAAQIKAKIRGFAYNLQTKRNKALVDMDLLNPERQLVHEGRLYRKPDFTDLEWTELQGILFDNYFAVTKLKTRQEGDSSSTSVWILAKRPIPVEMLDVSGFTEPAVTYSIGLNALHLRSDRESRDLWPFTVHHIGGKMEPLTLYATSKQRRNEWRAKLEEAKGLRLAVVEANKAFETVSLCDSVFALPGMSSVDADRTPPGADGSLFHGRITCAVPFSMADHRRLVALGCADGVWIGLRNDPSSFRKVLHLKMVTQCAVLEDFGLFVVLADKVLISYSLEALVPSSTSGATQPRPPQKLSGNRGVLFFGVGVLKERTLLVYMKKKANESVFKALEPVVNQGGSTNGKSGGGLFNKIKNDMSKNADWFRMFKVFFIPSEAYSMQFLRSKLAVVCARGFEIMNLDTLLPGTIPDFSRCPRDDARILALARRVEVSKPLGMFKLAEGDFLLCYDAFACYVDRAGEPIRLDNIVEWEGTPQTVAFDSPYILAFDTRFVEIREASTGRLVQIVRGSDMRYVSASTVVEGSGAERSIICTQRQRAAGGTRAYAYDQQDVFELVQTAPPLPADLRRKDTTATMATATTSSSSGLGGSGGGGRSGRSAGSGGSSWYARGGGNANHNYGGGGGGSSSNSAAPFLSHSATISSSHSGISSASNSSGGGGGGGGGGGAAAKRSPSVGTPSRRLKAQRSRGALAEPPAPAGWI